MLRNTNLRVVVGLSAVIAVVLIGSQFSSARDINPEQLLLQISDLPKDTRIQVQSALTPGSWRNGLITRDGADIVQGYVSGARIDLMTPLVGLENTSKGRSMSEAYIMNLAYRFMDESAAASEFQRQVGIMKSESAGQVVALKSEPSSGQMITFEAADKEIPSATWRWFFLQRGKYLLVLGMPGPLQSLTTGLNKQATALDLTMQSIEAYNQAVDSLFKANVAILQSR